MNWKEFAIQDLRKYNQLKQALQNIPERIEVINSRKLAMRSATMSAVPMHGGGNRYEDNLLNSIVEEERLKLNSVEADKLVGIIDRGLDQLNDTERRVLCAFYVDRKPRHVERLMDELHCERTTVYRIKDTALYKFTISMYGLIDF